VRPAAAPQTAAPPLVIVRISSEGQYDVSLEEAKREFQGEGLIPG
jgi:hypothetical protein